MAPIHVLSGATAPYSCVGGFKLKRLKPIIISTFIFPLNDSTCAALVLSPLLMIIFEGAFLCDLICAVENHVSFTSFSLSRLLSVFKWVRPPLDPAACLLFHARDLSRLRPLASLLSDIIKKTSSIRDLKISPLSCHGWPCQSPPPRALQVVFAETGITGTGTARGAVLVRSEGSKV